MNTKDKKKNKEYKEMMFIYICSVLCLSVFCTTMSGYSDLKTLGLWFIMTTLFWMGMLAPMIPNKYN